MRCSNSLFYLEIEQRAQKVQRASYYILSDKLLYLDIEHHVTKLEQDFLR